RLAAQAARAGVVVVFEGDLLVAQRGLARGPAGGRIDGRRRRRGHMVEEAVVLIEVHQQHGLAPDLWIGGQRVQQLLGVPGALDGAGRAGVLGVGRRVHHPGDLRQIAFQHILAQLLEEAAVGHGVGNALVERIADIIRRFVRGVGGLAGLLIGTTILLEAGQRIVGEVVGQVLVDLPAYAGLFQALGVGLPFVAQRRAAQAVPGVVDRALARAGGAVRAGPQEHAVGVGARVHGAVVGVAQGEGVGHGELERHFRFAVIAHGVALLVLGPAGHAAVVPGLLAVHPGVRRAVDALGIALGAVQVVGQHGFRAADVLLPDVAAVGQ